MHRSFWYTRNPVKVLHPFTNSDGFRIENRDLEKAISYLRSSGYSVQRGPLPGPPENLVINDINYSINDQINNLELTQQLVDGTITIPSNSFKIIFTELQNELVIEIYLNLGSNFTIGVVKGQWYSQNISATNQMSLNFLKDNEIVISYTVLNSNSTKTLIELPFKYFQISLN